MSYSETVNLFQYLLGIKELSYFRLRHRGTFVFHPLTEEPRVPKSNKFEPRV